MRVRYQQNRYLFIGVSAIIVLLAIGTTYYYTKYQDLKKNPNAANQATANKVIQEVGKLYVLPKGQTPTVAKIVNVNSLKGQAFFRNAQDSDQLLIYTKAQLAIIYRPSTDMIINAGPVVLNNSSGTSSTPAGTSAVPSKPVVAVLNASSTNGKAASTGASINSKFGSQASISSTYANASVKESKTLVVAVTSSDASLASQIASYLGGTVGSMPAGQSVPSGANIVVLVGQ
ncbi:MAG TPA: LytR C-terminal domain-containing protein [Candidatus Saccharimonadales bacterium]|nr:LytR C-terminal domain-containing protein [Candidatus Saccharimonadales bacterium]